MQKINNKIVGKKGENFSIFIINSRGEMMLQKRSRRKVVGAGLWSNACSGSSSVNQNEPVFASVHRRLREEMGFDCALSEIGKNKLGRFFLGRHDRDPRPSKKEASDWKWSTFYRIKRDLVSAPESYTDWFRKLFPLIEEEVSKHRRELLLRDYVSIGKAMDDLYKIPNDVSERWLHR